MTEDNSYQKKDNLISTWDRVSADYDESAYWSLPENRANLEHILAHLQDPRGKTIIEVGCGSGYLSLELAKRGATCNLLDVSPVALQRASNAFIDAGLPAPACYEKDALSSGIPQDTFDCVWNGGVIEHFYDKGKKALLTEMLRICKPGGLVIVQVPNRWCFQFQVVQAIQKLTGTWRYGFEDDMSPRRLARLCTDMGIRDFTTYAFNPVLGWRWVPVVRRAVRLSRLNTVEHHRRPSRIGFVSVLVIHKELAT